MNKKKAGWFSSAALNVILIFAPGSAMGPVSQLVVAILAALALFAGLTIEEEKK